MNQIDQSLDTLDIGLRIFHLIKDRQRRIRFRLGDRKFNPIFNIPNRRSICIRKLAVRALDRHEVAVLGQFLIHFCEPRAVLKNTQLAGFTVDQKRVRQDIVSLVFKKLPGHFGLPILFRPLHKQAHIFILLTVNISLLKFLFTKDIA